MAGGNSRMNRAAAARHTAGAGWRLEPTTIHKFDYNNIDGESLAGSADEYEVPNQDQLFIQYFARDCTGLEDLTAGSQCYSIGDMFPDCYDPADLTCDMLVLTLRDYILPGAQRGPAPELTISPRTIFLQRP